MKSLNLGIILTAMPFESALILSHMGDVRRIKVSNRLAFSGKLWDHPVVLVHTGIGKVNAAHYATALIERFHVVHVINTGVGGAYPGSGLQRGDIAVSLKEHYGDEGVAGDDWSDMRTIGIPLLQKGQRKYFNSIPVDRSLARKALTAARAVATQKARPFRIRSGNFVTVSATSGSQERALELEGRFRAICENMEGAAIAHICAIYGIPFLEVRGISNIAGIRDRRRWNLTPASENSQRVVLEVIRILREGQ